MRTARIREPSEGYYHVMSRVVDRRMVLDNKEKERFRRLLRRAELFSGVQILTYTVLDNHFHILLHVPVRQELSDQDFVRRLGALYDKTLVRNLAEHLAYLRDLGQDDAAEEFRKPYYDRMYDLSEFMKTLKQRFTQSFNRRHGRKGTLWEERFKSILVQGSQGALSAIAAYIDLNAVRAGIVVEPGNYRFCGYGEALGGSRRARQGLSAVMATIGLDASWQAVYSAYRQLVYTSGQAKRMTETGAAKGSGFSQEELQAVLDAGGELTMKQALHCRVRYFSDGLVLGTQAYVDEVFGRYRNRFGRKRTTGARKMKGADWGDLCTARRLRLRVIICAV